MAYEIDCDICGGHAEGNNCKQVCIHCFNNAIKKIRRQRQIIDKLQKKLNPPTKPNKSVVSPNSPLHELWDNPIDEEVWDETQTKPKTKRIVI